MGWVIGITLVLILGSSFFLLFLKLKKRHDAVATDARNLDLAMVKLSKQLKQNPHDAQALTKLGIIKLKKGELKAALKDLTRATQADPSNSEAHFHRGMALVQAADKQNAAKEFRWIIDHSEDPYFKTAARDRLESLKK